MSVSSEFAFELQACRWAELAWPPDRERGERAIVVARQLGTRHRRWDTIVLECDPDGLADRAAFGHDRLDGDLLHVIRNAPGEWTWYRDALPHPGYPWRYVREAIHRAADREILETRKRNNRIEIRRRWQYPDWVDRIVAIEHKPDLDASAAADLARQLEYDVALGLADEVWLATTASEDGVPRALFEAMPVEAGILELDPSTLSATVRWHPRQLDPTSGGTRIIDRPSAAANDRSAAQVEFVDPATKAETRREIAERAYERGWRSAVESMRPDCRHFTLVADSLTHEPHCRAKGRTPTSGECSGSCQEFTPEPPAWRTRGWPLAGGPGGTIGRLLERHRDRHR